MRELPLYDETLTSDEMALCLFVGWQHGGHRSGMCFLTPAVIGEHLKWSPQKVEALLDSLILRGICGRGRHTAEPELGFGAGPFFYLRRDANARGPFTMEIGV